MATVSRHPMANHHSTSACELSLKALHVQCNNLTSGGEPSGEGPSRPASGSGSTAFSGCKGNFLSERQADNSAEGYHCCWAEVSLHRHNWSCVLSSESRGEALVHT